MARKSRWEREADESEDGKKCTMVITMESSIVIELDGHEDYTLDDVSEDVENILDKICEIKGIRNVKVYRNRVSKEYD